MTLVWPTVEYLASYVAALDRGWSPVNARGAVPPQEEKERILREPEAFIAGLVDREAKGAPIRLRDGSTVPKLPGYTRWMWDGEFCGTIAIRWQPGTEALPPYCLGHIGYMVVPWKRRRGYATLALGKMLEEAKAEGLRYVEITTTSRQRRVTARHRSERWGICRGICQTRGPRRRTRNPVSRKSWGSPAKAGHEDLARTIRASARWQEMTAVAGFQTGALRGPRLLLPSSAGGRSRSA